MNEQLKEAIKHSLPVGFSAATHNDWESIYRLSSNTLVQHAKLYKVLAESRASMPFFLKEYRTIHMGSGRQNGKSAWAIDKMRESMGTIVIVKDKLLRDELIRRASIGKPTGKKIKIEVDARDADPMGTVQFLMQAYLTSNGVRIYTFKDLQSMVDNDPNFLKSIDRVILDESKYNRMLSSIYDLLGAAENPEMEIVALA